MDVKAHSEEGLLLEIIDIWSQSPRSMSGRVAISLFLLGNRGSELELQLLTACLERHRGSSSNFR